MVAVLVPVAKVASCDHCTVYAGLANPTPASVEAVQLQVGFWVAVGVVVLGVPGTVGAAVSLVVSDILAAATLGILPGAPYSTT